MKTYAQRLLHVGWQLGNALEAFEKFLTYLHEGDLFFAGSAHKRAGAWLDRAIESASMCGWCQTSMQNPKTIIDSKQGRGRVHRSCERHYTKFSASQDRALR